MRARTIVLLLGIAGLALASCNANPLLKAAASNYAPATVGSRWDYSSPDGTLKLSRVISGAGPYQGREAFSIASTINALPPSTSYIAYDGGDELSYNSTLGWILRRKLPLVSNNKWNVPSTNPLLTVTTLVDGLEQIAVPLGTYDACFRVRTRTETYDPIGNVTATAETLAWAAPEVGDIRYANLAGDGTITVTLELTGYSKP